VLIFCACARSKGFAAGSIEGRVALEYFDEMHTKAAQGKTRTALPGRAGRGGVVPAPACPRAVFPASLLLAHARMHGRTHPLTRWLC
jgi:hypothetical protein